MLNVQFFIYLQHFVFEKKIFLLNSLHARLSSRYEAWSYKKRKHKNIKTYIKSVIRQGRIQIPDADFFWTIP